jgi:hypothetical protein
VRKVEMIPPTNYKRPPGESSEVPPPPEERWLIPQRYGKVETSGLSVEVQTQGKNDFTLALSE